MCNSAAHPFSDVQGQVVQTPVLAQEEVPRQSWISTHKNMRLIAGRNAAIREAARSPLCSIF